LYALLCKIELEAHFWERRKTGNMFGKLQRIYHHRLVKWVVMLIWTTVVLFPVPAMAAPDRITRGDVEAVLEALPTGGRVVLFQASDTAGFHAAPADWLGSHGAIRPYGPWDGGHYCVDDWHALLLGFTAGGDQSFRREDAEALLSQVSLSFTLTLDGKSVVLDTVRTAIKPVLAWEEFGWDNIYGFQEGRIMSPDELGVGEYTLTVVWEVAGSSYELSSQFFIDPSDSEACLF
jgi:hypothetical protein